MLAPMRTTALLLAVAACSGPAKAPKSPNVPPGVAPVPEILATRWVPSHPSYVFASAKLRDAQRVVRDALDSLGIAAGIDAAVVGRQLEAMLAVDPLGAEPAAAVGVDVDAGIAIFSEDFDPTFVVHLASPEATAAFFDRERQRGMVSQSVLVDGVEVFGAQLATNVGVGWAIDHDWLWVHFALTGGHDTAWFAHSHHHDPADAPAWTQDWAWASGQHRGPATVLGFVHMKELLGKLAERAQGAMGCARLLEPVGRVAFALDGDLHHAAGRISLDLGPSARAVAASVLPPPPGWASVAAGAPLAFELNLDVDAVNAWISPCMQAFGVGSKALHAFGVRAARGVLLSLDPDEPSGSGAVALDLAGNQFFAKELDRVPMRSHLESARTFGTHAGHHLKIPFAVEFDYLLEDHLGAIAMGDGVLAKAFTAPTAGPQLPPPLLALDIAPPKLAARSWQWLLDKVAGTPPGLVDQLMRWRDAHVAVRLDGDALVLEASGTLR
jgi:hypothetical protein